MCAKKRNKTVLHLRGVWFVRLHRYKLAVGGLYNPLRLKVNCFGMTMLGTLHKKTHKQSDSGQVEVENN